MRYCTKCGSSIDEGKQFCTKCGSIIGESVNEVRIPEPIAPKKEENKDFTNTVENLTKNYKKRDNKTIIILVSLLISVAIGYNVFNKDIKAGYYVFRGKVAQEETKKLEFIKKALSFKNNDYIVKSFSDACNSYMEKSDNSIISTVIEVQKVLPKDTYKELLGRGYKADFNRYYKENNYEAAIASLIKAKEFLKTDYRQENNYENAMIKICSKLLNIPSENLTKEDLKQKYNIYFADLNNDKIDDIVVIKCDSKNSFDEIINAEVYSFQGEGYKLLVKQVISEYGSFKSGDIGYYDNNKPGIFISFVTGAHTGNSDILKLENNRLKSLLSYPLPSLYSVEFKDIDKDGITEIATMDMDPNSINQSYAGSDKIIRWYKIKDNNESVPVKTEYVKNNLDNPSTAAINQANISKLDFIFPNSDKEYLRDSDVANLSKEALAIARNEIFARHGYIFQMQVFRDYFYSKSWYIPNPNFKGGDEGLNRYEIANYQLIQRYEAN